jgi:hypothetical protein
VTRFSDLIRAARTAKGLVLREAAPELGYKDGGNNLAKCERGEELPGPKRLPYFVSFYGDVVDPEELRLAWAEVRVAEYLGYEVTVRPAPTRAEQAAATLVADLEAVPEAGPPPGVGERRRHSRRARDPPPP